MSKHHDDFDFEPVRGLPQILPKGERMLWQGAPRWQDLAVHAFHARKVVWYFVALAAAQAAVRLCRWRDPGPGACAPSSGWFRWASSRQHC